ncbi:hypothetical protein V8E51_005563 [Hyaloscypha variabilis]
MWWTIWVSLLPTRRNSNELAPMPSNKPKKKKVIVWIWVCCYCNASGMSLLKASCPLCQTPRCAACDVHKQTR